MYNSFARRRASWLLASSLVWSACGVAPAPQDHSEPTATPSTEQPAEPPAEADEAPPAAEPSPPSDELNRDDMLVGEPETPGDDDPAPATGPPPGSDIPIDESATTTAPPGTFVLGLVAPTVEWFETEWAATVAALSDLTIAEFEALYPLPPVALGIDFDASDAAYLPEVAAWLHLDATEEAVLVDQGIVAAPSPQTVGVPGLYHRIYEADLPVLITTDSILHALHRSFLSMLQALEYKHLHPALGLMLESAHAALSEAAPTLPDHLVAAAVDLDVYLTVARALWGDEKAAPHYLGNAARVEAIVEMVYAETPAAFSLFAPSEGLFDFSQFKPRGHYANNVTLQAYFRAMMWLGRLEFRLLDFPSADVSEAVFHRTSLEAAALLTELLDSSENGASWTDIEGSIASLIGARDSAGPPEVKSFLDTLATDSAGLADLSDEKLAQSVLYFSLGVQVIASDLAVSTNYATSGAASQVFTTMGQRFTLDSHVLSHVTHDRVAAPRMLPQVFDVLFALGMDWARSYLTGEIEKYAYQPNLAVARAATDHRTDERWAATFYDSWLHAIAAAADVPAGPALPAAMKTAAWRDKAANTAAASWAELRHDTVLYVKQSYSSPDTCTYPDGYVEPNPDAYHRMRVAIGNMREAYLRWDSDLEPNTDPLWTHWEWVLDRLTVISQKELAGEALSEEEFDFIRKAIEEEIDGCGFIEYDGWYAQLIPYFETTGPILEVADIHTAPTDAVGSDVGWVQHAATGPAAALVMIVESCDGLSSTTYVGPIKRYFAPLTTEYLRLTDSAWEGLYPGAEPPAFTSSFWPQ